MKVQQLVTKWLGIIVGAIALTFAIANFWSVLGSNSPNAILAEQPATDYFHCSDGFFNLRGDTQLREIIRKDSNGNIFFSKRACGYKGLRKLLALRLKETNNDWNDDYVKDDLSSYFASVNIAEKNAISGLSLAFSIFCVGLLPFLRTSLACLKMVIAYVYLGFLNLIPVLANGNWANLWYNLLVIPFVFYFFVLFILKRDGIGKKSGGCCQFKQHKQ